jgi:DNA (cytosine-5)-methyltransferase 1
MRVGSLFSGYGGLDMAVGGDLAWYSEIEPAACKVLEQLHPDVPNIGDITAVDWSQVEPVDVITGGYPCQPFSHAGLRKGKNDERHLWPYVRDALSAMGPRLAILENVRGHITLGFADVLADLAGMGWDARWGVVRASDAGAPHGRARLFIAAYPACGTRGAGQGWGVSESKGATGLATRDSAPVADTASAKRRGAQSEHLGATNGSTTESRERSGTRWGTYLPAIERWESITRPVPDPVIPGPKRDRLNPVFVEWMMGLPEGHVTGHGLSAAQELKMLGNGVVPQQAALALRLLGVR